MQRATSNRVRVRGLLAVAVLTLAASAAIPATGQDDLASLREQRRQVQAERAAAARTVDVQRAEVDELTDALEALQAEVSSAEVRVADAERRLADAEARVVASEQAVLDKQAEIAGLEAQLANRAVESFIGQSTAGEASMFDEEDLYLSMRMRSLVDAVTQTEADVVESLAAAREDLQLEEAAAEQARQDADTHRAEVTGELAVLAEARDAQAQLTAAADARLDQLLGEAQALAALEGELGREIATREQEEARRLAEAQAAARARAGTSSSGGSGASAGGGPIASAGEIVSVRGIWVHRSIASNLESMLAAAAADGHRFSGGGYRDSSSQIRLRRAHCGTSDYAVYEMSPSQCSPPTARPGASMHERGLAIDFVYNGSVINSRSSPGFQWLAANAASYGFYNLPSEPWHWSTSGG